MELTDKELERFFAKVDKSGECWIWMGAKKQGGYGKLTLRQQPFLASRVSWQIENGPIPEGLHVCHHCDNPQCVKPSHLFVGSRSDNMRDAKSKGRTKWAVLRGEANGRALLRENTVRRIRAVQGVFSASKTAGIFKCTKANVECIWSRRSWNHVHAGVSLV